MISLRSFWHESIFYNDSDRNSEISKLQRKTKEGQPNYDDHFSLGLVLLSGQYLEEAFVAFEYTIGLDPCKIEGYLGIAITLSEKHEYLEALKYLQDNKDVISKADDLEYLLIQGAIYREKKEYFQSEKKLNEGTSKYPQSAELKFQLGLLHYTKYDFCSALEYFELALKKDNRHLEALLYKAACLRELHKFDYAINFLDELERTFPNTEKWRINLEKGIICRLQKQYGKSIDYFQKALAISHNNSILFYHLGITYFEKKDIASSKKYFKIASEFDQANNEAAGWYALILCEYTQHKDALSCLDDFYNKNHHNNLFHKDLYRGLVFRHNGEIDKCVAHLNKAIDKFPDNSELYYNLGVSYQYFGMPEEAISSFIKALHCDQYNVETYFALSMAYMANDKRHEAIASINDFKALKLEDCEWKVCLYLSFCNTSAESYPKKLELLKEAESHSPQNTHVLFNLGKAYLENNNFNQAISYFEQVIEYDSYFIDAYLAQVEAYNKLGQYNKSLELLEYLQELRLDTFIWQVHYEKGICYFNSGDREKGAKELSNAATNCHGSIANLTLVGDVMAVYREYSSALKCYCKLIEENDDIVFQ